LVPVFGSLFAGLVVHGMEPTTPTPEVTTEDASGRLLSLPNPEKCANRKFTPFKDSEVRVRIPGLPDFSLSKHAKTGKK
jgi:hypothetical protein